MKSLQKLFLLLFVLLSSASYSQQQRFIELTVADSVSLQATKIVYEINLGTQIDFMGMKMKSEENENDKIPDISTITKLLDKEKFTYSISKYKGYTLSKAETTPSIEVTLLNEQELQRLFELLKNQEGISGKLKQISYEPISKYTEVVFKKLYAKALSQAKLMVTTTGNTLGNLISVSEVTTNTDQFMDIYKTFLKKMPLGLLEDENASMKIEIIQRTFRFEIK